MDASYESQRPKSDFDIHKTGTSVFQIENLYPLAFVPIQKDPALPGYGRVFHADGAGSKPIVSYLLWKETGDPEVFRGLAADIVAMNLNDMFCAGRLSDIEFADYVAINRFKIPKEEFLREIKEGLERSFRVLAERGVSADFLGGETAEAADQVRTVDISAAARARVKLDDVISGERIQPGDAIVGLGSFGRAAWEERENSGIMCNGLSVVRHALLSPKLAQEYPEIADPEAMEYKGRFRTGEYVQELGMTVGEALVSPTRIFAPALTFLLEKYGPEHIHGMVHNTGGGLTKCLRVGGNLHYVKETLLPIPPIFLLVQQESGRSWQSIFEGLNSGVGMELMVAKDAALAVVEDLAQFQIPSAVIGRCEENAERAKPASSHGNRLTIRSEHGTFEYPYKI